MATGIHLQVGRSWSLQNSGCRIASEESSEILTRKASYLKHTELDIRIAMCMLQAEIIWYSFSSDLSRALDRVELRCYFKWRLGRPSVRFTAKEARVMRG